MGDCTVRAVSAALDQGWTKTYMDLCAEGLALGDMPSANRVWGSYLERNGFKRRMVEAECSKCYTIKDFCREHPRGVYVLALSGHVVTARDGCWWDSWDSSDECPIFSWCKEGE